MSHHVTSEIPTDAKIAAGILPFFDNKNKILLGKEYRKRYDSYSWMEFGGKQEKGESLAEVACREANEETAGTLGVQLSQVEFAELNNHYIDYYNPDSKFFYRMYCVNLDTEKPSPETFLANSKEKDHVEMVEWEYFNAQDVLSSSDGTLPGTDVKLYSTMLKRLEKLKGNTFFL